jgi:asparagine synthase (glutamine-hydrolysing)
MCGIAGFFDVDGFELGDGLAVARAMAAPLAPRGPDDDGVWADAAGIAFGFRRLSILDLSPHGHQPMRSASGRYTVVFNGEIYNHLELRAEMEARGQRFHGRSDTEVLLATVEELGFEGMLKRIRGMFAIAIWDGLAQTLSLARDRMGEKPLYCGWTRGGGLFVFGSELKALRAHPGFAPRIDRAALMRFIRHGYVPSPLSIYEGIAKLPPGTWLQVSASNRAARPTPYYSLVTVAEDGLRDPLRVGLDEAADLLEAELLRAVEEQMIADVPLGAFLSGGIDSSLVCMLMQRVASRPIKTFSIGFTSPRFDESAYARAVADRLGTDHTELRVSAEDALALIPSLPVIYDEPFADSSQLPTTLVSRLARAHVTVALTGDGGDELFAGYPRYEVMRRIERPFALPGRRALGELGHRVVDLLTRDGTAPTIDQRLVDWARRRTDVARTKDLDAFYELYMSLWYHPDWVVRGVEEPAGIMPLAKDVLARGNVTERAMLVDTVQNLPDALLTKVDRAAMSASLETRLPLLDREVVALAWRLPFATKVQGRRGKMVMRRILSKQLPARLFDRPKMGFMIPVVDWLRGPLRGWAEALLDERRIRDDGFLDATVIRRRWNAFLAGVRDWHGLLWPVLMWQAWRERNRDVPH